MEVGGDRYHPCPDDLVDPLGGPTIYLTLDQDNPDLLREDGGSNRLEPKLPDQGVDRTRTNSLRQHNLNWTRPSDCSLRLPYQSLRDRPLQHPRKDHLNGPDVTKRDDNNPLARLPED